jgi:hypothetical protein
MTATQTDNGRVVAGVTYDHTRFKQRKQPPSLQSTTGLSEMANAPVKALVSPSPTDWSLLKNGQLFSVAADGSNPCIKVSRSKAWNLTSGQSFPVGGGQCYRVVVV